MWKEGRNASREPGWCSKDEGSFLQHALQICKQVNEENERKTGRRESGW
jgi:hypothetical protein